MYDAQIERGRDRLAIVDSAARGAQVWFVSGEVENGAQLRDFEGGSYAPPLRPITDHQYDDATYARARAAIATPAEGAYSS